MNKTMVQVTVPFIILMLAALAIPASSASSLPDVSKPQLSQMDAPVQGDSISSRMSLPSGSDVYSPADSTDGALNNMQFFQHKKAELQPVEGIPASDVEPIMEYIAQLPPPQQVQQAVQPESQDLNQPYSGGNTKKTAKPTAKNTFTNVSSTVPSDKVIFLEETKTTMFVDPTSAGIIFPSVVLNYKYDEKNNSLQLRKKNNTDINRSSVIVGYTEDNEVDGRYIFDYEAGSGSSPTVMGLKVLFTGADGRVAVMFNGNRTELMPDEKAEYTYVEGNSKNTISLVNHGLIPRSSIEVKDRI